MTYRLSVAFLSLMMFLLVGCGREGSLQPDASDELVGQKDVTFFGTGKVARYQQKKDSSLEMLGPIFFSEIFIAKGGKVTDASVKFPDPIGDTRQLEYRYSESDEIGDVMYLSGSAETYEELEKKYPTGDYTFNFSTPGGDVVDSIVGFKGATFPRQPIILFEQDGARIEIDKVNPLQDLVITWPPFEEGSADENGVLDDLIFVAIDSCTVEDIVHSGRPFEKDDYLTFSASEYLVPANTFLPGQTYSMYVEHALLPHTHKEFGMPAFATLAASTYMDFQTTGETDPDYCSGSK